MYVATSTARQKPSIQTQPPRSDFRFFRGVEVEFTDRDSVGTVRTPQKDRVSAPGSSFRFSRDESSASRQVNDGNPFRMTSHPSFRLDSHVDRRELAVAALRGC